MTTAYGRAALDALKAVVREAKSDDPMSPVTVIAPNNVAGIVARRHLATGDALRPGIAGIEITTLSRLAERLALVGLTPRRPATGPIVAAAWRQALAEAPGVFADIRGHPATVRALAMAHADLRTVGRESLVAIAAASELSADLVRLHELVGSRLQAGWYDVPEILRVAAAQMNDAIIEPPPGRMILYLPQRLSQPEQDFLAALSRRTPVAAVVGMTGVKRADEPVERALSALGGHPADLPTIATASSVINASDADDEVRCVVRDLVEVLKVTPAHRVAVLYAARLPHARLLHEQLAAAGITLNGSGSRPADERAVSRALLEVLRLTERDVPRADLFRALSGVPAQDFAGRRIPLSSWERTSRSAGVVAGDDWGARLGAYATDRQAQAAMEDASADSRPWLAERLRRDATVAEELGAFVGRLREELRRAAEMSSWPDLATWCLNLFTALLGDEAALLKLPPEEQVAAATAISILRSLDGLDAVEDSASLQGLCDVLEIELAASTARVGKFGEGVLVAPLSAAVGLDVDVVYAIGLSEDQYPGRLRTDPLLPDRVRALSAELESHRDQLNAKYRHLLAAFSAARVRSVASFPRGDLRRSTRRIPSRWLLPSLRELSGDRTLAATEWETPNTYGPNMVTSGSYAGELLRSDHLATEQEWRTRQLAAGGPLDDEAVSAALEMIRARDSDAFTRYDGNLSGEAGLPDYLTGDLTVSPTALESYAGCPHTFFVQRLLKVEPLDQPEDIVVISPMEIGNLIHQSVETLVQECSANLPGFGAPWSDEQTVRFQEIVAAAAHDFQQRGLTGHQRLWERERVRILNDAAWLIEDDNQWRAARGAKVVASEMPFGLKGTLPVEVVLPGGRVLMKGSADKVDQAEDGTIFVTDIKTGSRRTFKDIAQDNPVVGGTKLQLPVYAYAATSRYGVPSSPVHATYWFVRRDRGRLGLDLTRELEATYAATLSVLVRSIAHGLFPLKAPEGPDVMWVQCPYCNPDGVGHSENRRRWERKRNDPALADLLKLISPTEVDGATP